MQYTHKIILSDDGSNTLFVPELNETYHSTHGAVQEARHVFIKMGLEYLKDLDKKEINVLEIGFGTGLNAILAYEFSRMGIKINYYTIEAYPVATSLVEQLNYFEFIEDSYKPIFLQLHELDWEKKHVIDENFSFTKLVIKLEELEQFDSKIDCVFFDAFAPSRQADMWTVEQLSRVKQQMKDKGVLVTYCANGQFKRNLKALNFEVTGVPGPPGKREMTRAFARQ